MNCCVLINEIFKVTYFSENNMRSLVQYGTTGYFGFRIISSLSGIDHRNSDVMW